MKAAPVVLIHGEESFLVDSELADVEAECSISGQEDLNRQVYDASEADSSSIVSAAKTMPFMGKRRLIIVKNATAWKADQWERIVAYCANPNPSTCLVIVAPKPDKRLSWWKGVQKTARLVECSHPRESEMQRWAARLASEAGLKLDPPVLNALGNMVEPDLGLLWREILKLKAFAGEDGKVGGEDMLLLVGETRATNVFALCDAIAMRDPRSALEKLKKLLDSGEPAVMLLYMIARHFRLVWKARDLKGGANMAQALGVPPFVATKLASQASGWDARSLGQAFELFLETDVSLKSGGGEEDLYSLVFKLCGKK